MNLINQYKRLDVFKCSQEAHRQFNGKVSVYHVLKEKQCYPQGCLYFLWHCVLLQNGKPCIHAYRYTGKNCRGCTYFDEDKIHLQPELLLDEKGYDLFLNAFDSFESWLQKVCFRRLDIAGRIKKVKPWFCQILFPKETHIKLYGYLLVLRYGFVGMDTFADTFYIRVSERQMKTYKFVPKMKIELEGEIRTDRGRIVVHRPGKIEILNPGWGKPWSHEQALVAVKTATLFKNQPEKCLECGWGALADVVDRRRSDEKRYRNLFCLKSITDSEGCYLYVTKRIRKTNIHNI